MVSSQEDMALEIRDQADAPEGEALTRLRKVRRATGRGLDERRIAWARPHPGNDDAVLGDLEKTWLDHGILGGVSER